MVCFLQDSCLKFLVMAKKAISLYKYLLGILMGLLGFISCSKSEVMVAYGTPEGTLKIKALVLDADGKPISGASLRVRLLREGRHGTSWTPGVDFPLKRKSDSNGKIDTTGTFIMSPSKNETFFVYHSEDNPALGDKYANDSIRINPVKLAEKDGWNWGAYELEGTLKLKEKKSDK